MGKVSAKHHFKWRDEAEKAQKQDKNENPQDHYPCRPLSMLCTRIRLHYGTILVDSEVLFVKKFSALLRAKIQQAINFLTA